MPLEIERRFIVSGIGSPMRERLFAEKIPVRIRQGYLPNKLRVRVRDGLISEYAEATLTRKVGRGLVRDEVEQKIDVSVAETLLSAAPIVLTKDRYVRDGWEIDFFRAPLDGLILIEHECASIDEARALLVPTWAENAVEVTETLTNRQLAEAALFLRGNVKTSDLIRPRPKRVVLTGAPCSGKTSFLNEYRWKDTASSVHVVPETATILMHQVGVTPARMGPAAFQRTMFNVQRSFEDAADKQASREGKRGLILDRGTIDAVAFMQGGWPEFEAISGETMEEELDRYTGVILLAVPPKDVYDANKKNNAIRTETWEQSMELEKKLMAAWSAHPNLIVVNSTETWSSKVAAIEAIIIGMLGD